MAFLGGLFGSSTAPESSSSSSSGSSDHTTSADLFKSTTFTSNVQNPHPAQSSPSGLPLPPSPAGDAPPPPPPAAPTALDMFSTSAYDPAKLHPLAGLDKMDFLQLDEDKLTDVQGAASVLPSRGWTDDLCVGTGTTYLSGLGIGGAWGFKEGFSRPLGNNTSFKLRLNSVLNGCTRRGTFVGNSLGVLAIFYNLTNSSLDNYRGKHDYWNSMGAGAVAGAIYKSTAGVRPAMVGAGLGIAFAASWSFFKTIV